MQVGRPTTAGAMPAAGQVRGNGTSGTSGPRLAAVSVDMDEVDCYCAIHGLGEPPREARWAIYRHALPRFTALFEELGIPATFFVVGRHLQSPEARSAVAALYRAGHEIGNHSQDHLYDLTRRSPRVIDDQVEQANLAIEAATGARPEGFRAPGYTITDAVFEVLGRRGMLYDSSVFPCPAYYMAKAAALAAIRARGRRSHSLLDTPRVLAAPCDPYRVGAPFHRPGTGLRELPIGVTSTGTGRLPYIGSALCLAGTGGARLLTRAIRGRPLVNLELHGMDLADAERDGLGFLTAHQPDLRRTLTAKRAALRAAIDALREDGYRFVTLATAARDVG